MEKNKNLVAISKDETKVFIVKNVSDNEYNRLLNKENETDSKNILFQKEFLEELHCNTKRVTKIDKRDIVIAKSVYDNFVDRGLIENDEQFQQMWFDFYFNENKLDFDKCPKEFTKILEKVREL